MFKSVSFNCNDSNFCVTKSCCHYCSVYVDCENWEGNRTINQQTKSRLVKSQTGQFADWITRVLDNSPSQLAKMFDTRLGQKIAPNVIFTNSLSASWPLCEVSSPQVIQRLPYWYCTMSNFWWISRSGVVSISTDIFRAVPIQSSCRYPVHYPLTDRKLVCRRIVQ